MGVTEARFRYRGDDGAALAGFRWTGAGTPRAVVQLAHGAGEHSGRYRERLAPLAEAGFPLYAADHRGHGLTGGMSHLGDFGPGGAAACVADMAALSRLARDENPGLPLVLMGHSMGAMFSQAYLLEHAGLLDALVLSGTRGPGARRWTDPNDAFPDARTPYDWLSRDPAEVDAYIGDPFCGIRFTDESSRSFREVAGREPAAEKLAPARGLPVYVFVGDEDPVNDGLAALTPLLDAYRAAGLDVTDRVYPGGRHEMLNETNRDEVMADLVSWLEERFPAA